MHLSIAHFSRSSSFSKIEFHAGIKGARARQVRIQIERIEFVILVPDVQQSHLQLGESSRKAVPGEDIELPEIIARQVGRIASVRLTGPEGIGFSERLP